jgi:hypothetical protein
MPGPYDYTLNVQTPFQALAQGYQAGAAIRNDQFAQQQQATALQQQQQQQRVIQGLISNPNAGATDYSNAMLVVPGLKDQLAGAWKTKSEAQQQASLSDTSQWAAAIQQGQPQVASAAIRARADAMDNSAGAPTPQSKMLRTQADVIDAHPEFAGFLMKAKLSSMGDAGSKVVDQLARLKQQPDADKKLAAEADLARTGADVAAATAPEDITKKILANKDTASQIDDRANRFALDKDKFRSDMGLKVTELSNKLGELPEFVAKDVTSAATDAIASQQSAARMTDLASRLEAVTPTSGVVARAGEALKRLTGSQDEFTRLRSEYSRIVTPAAMAAYKKVASGSTSDKDIDTAMTGVPSDTADPATMVAFLRGAAKLQVYDSVLNNARSEWLQAVHNLGKSKSDITVDGVTVPAGTAFKAFTDAYVEKKVAAQVNANDLATRGYMKYATPAAAAPAPATPLNDALAGGAGVSP